ncbi:uncharacterized protein LOC131937051 [Physella acuta]|uniref:uncharacterized protein LOC131937051 n=1 Tax=Physella acuta TaxID=109671 RepID=UPI0027DD17C5|nr:uncharacterized protein LOC131937051 [Physella acuta]
MDTFKGFMIQARSADLNQDQSPKGNFTVVNNTQTACSGKALVHTNRNLKFNLTFNWTAPTEPVGPIVFRATFVREYSVYWTDVVSEVLFNGSTSLLPNNVAKATTLNESCTPAPVSCSAATEMCANAYAKNVSLHPFNGSLICIDATNNLKCIFAACNYSPEMQAYLINSTQAALVNVSSKCVINITVNPASGCQTAAPICIHNHLRLLQNSYEATSGLNTYCPNITDLYMCLSDGYCSMPEIILAIDSITSYDLSSRGIKCDVDFFRNGTMVTTTPAPVSCEVATSTCSNAYAKNVSLHPSNSDLICIDVNNKLRCIFKACNYSPEMEWYVINSTQTDILSMLPYCKINVTASTVSACQRGTPACVASYLTMLQNSQEATSGSVQYCP